MKIEKNSNDFSYVHNIWTKDINFYGNTNPVQLIKKYGSPLYVYNETILRQRCEELRNIISYPKLKINYSAKANTNLTLLKIIHEEGLLVDAMSPGEIFIEMHAGFKPEEILFISNNVSGEEMMFAINHGIVISVDSLSQLEKYGKLNRGGKVVVRINPGVGAGHHEKVITGGKNTKFGINPNFLTELKTILKRYDLMLLGINQHIGSLFMTPVAYLEAAKFIFSFAENFPDIEFVDIGGGFGIPYHKEAGEARLDLHKLGTGLQEVIDNWVKRNGRQITVKMEPGRYTVAECGILLGEVYSIKENANKKYIGTDIGFNVLIRPALYDAYHDIEIYSSIKRENLKNETVTVVGNICETGDIIAKDRNLPEILERDILGILDSGAYGMAMSSNYNCRLRPAEVLINVNGDDILIKRRDEFNDLIRQFPNINS
jgi:diaminopimelate decarboxylase